MVIAWSGMRRLVGALAALALASMIWASSLPAGAVFVDGRIEFIGVRASDLRLRDVDSTDKLKMRGGFTLGAGSDGINPTTESVVIRLSTGGMQFYPDPAGDINPLTGFDVLGRAPNRKWALSESERTRTGIEKLEISEKGTIFLVDRRTSIPTQNYQTVAVEFLIGDDRLIGDALLVEAPSGSGRWRLAR